jgi:serine/threonine protein kinase
MGKIPGYKIIRKIGSGGMADVYLATQTSFGRDVAIKILQPSTAGNKEFAARFIREAKIVARLSHPHIIPVYQAGKVDQYYFMSMDYLPGGDLAQWIKGGIPEDEILNIIGDIADALHYAHQKGYMHRDIKPANIMFRENNSAVLTDFGIARLQDASDQLTQAGTIVGTPTYMSPEAIRGKEPDGRCDIYALGIVFYEMLMHKPPYKASDFTAIAVKHIQEPIPTLPKAYAKYQAFLNKFIAKDPKDRFQSGREIIRAIDELKKESKQQAQGESQEVSEPTPLSLESGSSQEKSPLLQKLSEIKEGFSFEERKKRKGGLFKSYSLVCNLNVSDAHSLSLIFTQASDQLIEWHKKRGDQSNGIEFNFLTESWCFDRADESIIKLYNAGGVYEFMKKAPIEVNMVSYDGGADRRYMISKKGIREQID